MIWSTAKQVRSLLKAPWTYEEIVLMRKAVAGSLANLHAVNVQEHCGNRHRISNLYQKVGGSISEDRVRQRLARGLKFYEARQNGAVVATTWMIMPGQRFLDEIGLNLVVPNDSLWLRDICVAPQARGQRVFSAFLSEIISCFHPNTRDLWSDVSTGNMASLRAHTTFGFEKVEVLKVLHLAGLLMMRFASPKLVGCAGGFKPDSRILMTGRDYQAYRAAWLA